MEDTAGAPRPLAHASACVSGPPQRNTTGVDMSPGRLPGVLLYMYSVGIGLKEDVFLLAFEKRVFKDVFWYRVSLCSA